jgi:hypothetical protein
LTFGHPPLICNSITEVISRDPKCPLVCLFLFQESYLTGFPTIGPSSYPYGRFNWTSPTDRSNTNPDPSRECR